MTKKLLTALLAAALMLPLCACSDSSSVPNVTSAPDLIGSQDTIITAVSDESPATVTEPVGTAEESGFGELSDPNTEAYEIDNRAYLPKADTEMQLDYDDIFMFTSKKKAVPFEKIGGKWLTDFVNGYNGISIEEYALYNTETDSYERIAYPENFPKWIYGSNSAIIMQDRYYYEWNVYDDAERLIRIDAGQNKLDILRTVTDDSTGGVGTSFVKLDEDRFLICYQRIAPPDDIYDLYNVVEVCDVDGNYTEILCEGRIKAYYPKEQDVPAFYEKPATDSVGYHNAAYSVYNGEIYALSHQRINDESKWTLRRFNDKGEELGRIRLNNFGYLSYLSSVNKFCVIGDYLLASDDYYSNCYIIKINGGDDRVILKFNHWYPGIGFSNDSSCCEFNDKYFAVQITTHSQDSLNTYVFDPSSGKTALVKAGLHKEVNLQTQMEYFHTTPSGELVIAITDYADIADADRTYLSLDFGALMESN